MPDGEWLLQMSEFIESALNDQRFHKLYLLWRYKRDDGKLPARSDFDPLEMPHLLRYLCIMDVERKPLRIRVRLVGTALVEAMGQDTTGRYMDELEGTRQVISRMHHMIRTSQPYFAADLPVTWTSQDHATYSVLGLPLASDGTNVDKLMFMMLFD